VFLIRREIGQKFENPGLEFRQGNMLEEIVLKQLEINRKGELFRLVVELYPLGKKKRHNRLFNTQMLHLKVR
jgi:hypothetical protein